MLSTAVETVDGGPLVVVGAICSAELEQADRKAMAAINSTGMRRLIIPAVLKDLKRSAHFAVRTLATRLS